MFHMFELFILISMQTNVDINTNVVFDLHVTVASSEIESFLFNPLCPEEIFLKHRVPVV